MKMVLPLGHQTMSVVGNLFYSPSYPALKHVTYVLSNGASVRLNIATEQKGPKFSNYDVFNHILWDHKIETDASMNASRDVLPVMSSYYNKFSKKDSKPSQFNNKAPKK
ncbi:hypothetical protein CEUSTIGMA_g11585.t1 [Chlamydomonas eustigma]|uniref:Uncharacterized protein n=1 Tax=Chlamydomonas eustigma TaxID=1157962 RepID=A0A250XMN8_9CHLO|nr:hypothetical protein CEUSTIGMA_g11585.t1 [Chlamydomonas eustigma]|eukprot:GAX84162.1 hypothetical protein CEUSTIGMA_g11585.t1 [Chlamydomonas eustigma]